jgi:hypothetical protein
MNTYPSISRQIFSLHSRGEKKEKTIKINKIVNSLFRKKKSAYFLVPLCRFSFASLQIFKMFNPTSNSSQQLRYVHFNCHSPST